MVFILKLFEIGKEIGFTQEIIINEIWPNLMLYNNTMTKPRTLTEMIEVIRKGISEKTIQWRSGREIARPKTNELMANEGSRKSKPSAPCHICGELHWTNDSPQRKPGMIANKAT